MYLFVVLVPDTKILCLSRGAPHQQRFLSALLPFFRSLFRRQTVAAGPQLATNGSTEMATRAEREELDGWKKERSQVKSHSDQSSIFTVATLSYEGRGRGPDSRQIISRSSSRVSTCVAPNSKTARSSSMRGRTNEQEAPPLSKQVSGWGRGDYIISLLLTKIKIKRKR